MRQPTHAATTYFLILLLVCASRISSQAQNLQKNTAAKNESSSLAYSVRPVLLPPSVSAILLKSHLNLAYTGHVLLRGFAINDKGEAAFAIVSESKNARVGGVYTENRTVVSVGDTVSGKRIYDFSDVRINNQGQVSYRASDDPTHASDGVQGIFVEKSLVCPPGSYPIFSQYLLSDNGQVYVFTGSVFDDGSVGCFGTDSGNGIIYKSQAIPSLALQNPYDATPSGGFTPNGNAPNDNSVHTKSLPEDVVDKLATLISRDPFVSKYNGGLYHWKPSIRSNQVTGRELEPSVNLVLSIDKGFRNTVFSSPLGGLYYDNSNRVWQREIYHEYVAKGLRFSDTAGPHGYVVPSPTINRKGQLLFSVTPTPQDTRMFVLALATPDDAPAPESGVVRIRTDANRDGAIRFDDVDKTSLDKPYTFWLNDNSDVMVGGELEDQDPAQAKQIDNSLPNISNARDLEDFERLQIKLPSDFHANQDDWRITLQFTETSDNPEINVVPAPNAGLSYLTSGNDVISFGKKIGPISGEEETPLPLSDLHVQDGGIIPLLFEGVGIGKGALTVRIYKSGVELSKDQVYLNLLPLTKMYDHYTADPLETGDLQSDSGDSNSVKPEQILDSPRLVNRDSTKHDTNDYILFVHGWRMQRWERIAFGQTAFKRLWHLGYKGRFGLFTWPTEYTDNPGPQHPLNYDESEQKAFISAKALHYLLAELNSESTYKGRISIFAHSMGNIVASEALHLETESGTPEQLVKTYIASQAAVPAQSYDKNTPVNLAAGARHPLIPNIYAYYPTGRPDRLPYFHSLNLVAGKLVNFYNPVDFAVASRSVWLLDQYLKPDAGYGYDVTTGFYKGTIVHDPLNVLTNQRYEIFALAAPAFSYGLGAQADVKGPFTTSEQVDLQDPPYVFTDQHVDHSAQFEQSFSRREAYWRELLDVFGLGKGVPN